MEFLHKGMNHPVSQQCMIYQLEEIQIKAGKTPDELIKRIWGLADRCNFPTQVEKERHIQFRLVHTLSDRDLVWKLLAMKIEATTSEMLATCHTHIAISDMSFNGLSHYHSECCAEGSQEITLWKLHQAPQSWQTALPSTELHMQFLPQARTLESQMQEG